MGVLEFNKTRIERQRVRCRIKQKMGNRIKNRKHEESEGENKTRKGFFVILLKKRSKRGKDSMK